MSVPEWWNIKSWEAYRRSDGTLDLHSALDTLAENEFQGDTDAYSQALLYLKNLMRLTPIRSRQSAAVAIANALRIAKITIQSEGL